MPMSSHVLVVTTPPAPQRQLVYSVKFPEELFQQVVEQQGGRVRFAKGNDAIIVGGKEYPITRHKENRRTEFFRESSNGSNLAIVGTAQESINITYMLGSQRISKISEENLKLTNAERDKQSQAKVFASQQSAKGSKMTVVKRSAPAVLNNVATPERPSSPANFMSAAVIHQPNRMFSELGKLSDVVTPAAVSPFASSGSVSLKRVSKTTASSSSSSATAAAAAAPKPPKNPAPPAKPAKAPTSEKTSNGNSHHVVPEVDDGPRKKLKIDPALGNSVNDVTSASIKRPGVTTATVGDLGNLSLGSIAPITSHSVYKKYSSIYNEKYQQYNSISNVMQSYGDMFKRLEQQLKDAPSQAERSLIQRKISEEFERAGGDSLSKKFEELKLYLTKLKNYIHEYVASKTGGSASSSSQ